MDIKNPRDLNGLLRKVGSYKEMPRHPRLLHDLTKACQNGLLEHAIDGNIRRLLRETMDLPVDPQWSLHVTLDFATLFSRLAKIHSDPHFYDKKIIALACAIPQAAQGAVTITRQEENFYLIRYAEANNNGGQRVWEYHIPLNRITQPPLSEVLTL